jgi:hypothetical protein
MVSGAAHPTITMHVASASIAFLMINRPFEFRTPYARLPRLLEYGEHTVARHVHNAPTMSLDLFTEDGAVRFERGHSGLVVVLHKPRIPRHIGGENRLELSNAFGVGHDCLPVTVRRERLI